MNRSTTLWKMLFLICLPLWANAQQLLLPDLSVSSITVTKVDGDDFSFKYNIKNTGNFGAIFLKRFYFQAYVSQDAVLDENDLPAGGSIFGDDAPSLAVGQTYSDTWSSYPFGSIEDYHYLIFDVNLRSGQSQAEWSTSNNRLVKDLRPSFPDLLVGSIKIENIDANNRMKVTYGIKNIGSATLHLDRFTYEFFLSANSTYQPNADVFAGTGTLNHGSGIFSKLVLAPGAVDSVTVYTNSLPTIDLNKYPYLLFRAHAHREEPQKSRSNDNAAVNCSPAFISANMHVHTLNSFDDQEISVGYTVFTDAGAKSNLYLDRFLVRAYFSADPVLNPQEDFFIGEKPVTTTPVVLTPYDSYSSEFTSALPPIDLTQRPYLILALVLKPGKVHPLRGGAVKSDDMYLGQANPEFGYAHIHPRYVTNLDQLVEFSFRGKNFGKKNLDLSRYEYDVFLSADQTLDQATDVFVLTEQYDWAERILTSNELTSTIAVFFVSPVDVNRYPYVFLRTRIKPGFVDNQLHTMSDIIFADLRPVIDPAPGGRTAFAVIHADQRIHIESNENKEQPSDYLLYALSGEKVAEGSFQEQQQLSTAGLSSGLYVLTIIQDGKREVHKLMIQE